MELRKKLVLPFAGLLAACGIAATAFTAAPAMANEATPDAGVLPATTEDQPYFFTFSGYGATQGTEPAGKDDDSASYINVNNMTIYDVHLYIDGIDANENYINSTVGGYAYLVDPGQWWIHNTVYENDMRSARLTALASEEGVLGGEWSPDSWGTYPSLN